MSDGEDERPLVADLGGREGLDARREAGAGSPAAARAASDRRSSVVASAAAAAGVTPGARRPPTERNVVSGVMAAAAAPAAAPRPPAATGNPKPSGMTPDDARADAVDRDAAVDDRRLAAEHDPPGAVRQHDRPVRRRARRPTATACGPAAAGVRAIANSSGSTTDVSSTRVSPSRPSSTSRERVAGDRAPPSGSRPAARARSTSSTIGARPSSTADQADDALALGQRDRPDHRGVQEREGEGAETEAAGQDQHGQERRARAAGQQAQGVADVASKHPGRYAARTAKLADVVLSATPTLACRPSSEYLEC